MRSILVNRIVRSASIALCLLILTSPASAQASGALLLSTQFSSSLMVLLGSGSLCVGYTYDLNGNRVSQAVSTIGSGPVLWGSGTYGCFVWEA